MFAKGSTTMDKRGAESACGTAPFCLFRPDPLRFTA
jgi:hypothetical protein